MICKLLNLYKTCRLPLGLPHVTQRKRQGPEERGFAASHDRADKLCSSEACKPLPGIPGHQYPLWQRCKERHNCHYYFVICINNKLFEKLQWWHADEWANLKKNPKINKPLFSIVYSTKRKMKGDFNCIQLLYKQKVRWASKNLEGPQL